MCSCTLKEWQQQRIHEKSLIVQASTMDGNDGQTVCSIGAWYQYPSYKNNYYKLHTHDKTVLCAFSEFTDNRRRGNKGRQQFMKNLANNGIINETMETKTYYETLGNYKFVISPEGNGIDCHRHYEALIYGCIPIIEDNPIIRAKYGNVPILWTVDYSEITEEYLELIYNEMLNKTWDFKALFINSWSNEDQELIKIRSNYWMMKTTGATYY